MSIMSASILTAVERIDALIRYYKAELASLDASREGQIRRRDISNIIRGLTEARSTCRMLLQL